MYPKTIDLHTHTTASDGSMTPTELVEHAAKSGLSAIAVSDHDCTDGIDEALDAGKRFGIEIIPAIELSVQSATETHILGYYIDHKNKFLLDKLEEVREIRRKRNREVCDKLNELGMSVSLEEVAKTATGRLFGSTHFAAVLIKKGYVSSMREAFEMYLGHGKPAHSDIQCLSPEDAVKLIKVAGGRSFLAHPHLIKIDDTALKELIRQLKAFGLDGIEGYYTDYTPEMQEKFIGLAKEFDLMISGGTDYHGIHKPHITIGKGLGNMSIPYSVLEDIKSKFNYNYQGDTK